VILIVNILNNLGYRRTSAVRPARFENVSLTRN
jgi:hypothetical protein